MNKYIIGLLVLCCIIAMQADYRTKMSGISTRGTQNPMTTMPTETKGHLPVVSQPLQNKTAPMYVQQQVQQGAMQLRVATRKTYEAEMQACELNKNNQQQFLCKLGALFNKLAAQYSNLRIKQCERPEGQELARYYNPTYVGKKTVLGAPKMCFVSYVGMDKNNEKQQILDEIDTFAKANYGPYQQQCTTDSRTVPQNVLLRYQNSKANGGFCYVSSTMSLEKNYTFQGAPIATQEPMHELEGRRGGSSIPMKK